MAGSLTPELQQFIARYVHSVEQLEILCLLSAGPIRSWSVTEVYRNIQSSEKSVAGCLEEFSKGELLITEPSGRYRFGPKSPVLQQLTGELSAAYRERRVTVIETIYSRPPDPIQNFAEAFRLRKEK